MAHDEQEDQMRAVFAKLFGQGDAPPALTAWSTNAASGHLYMAESFRDAAVLLDREVRQAAADGRRMDPDGAVLSEVVRPILFLMRHSLELALKEAIHRIVEMGVVQQGEWNDANPELPRRQWGTHRLNHLADILELCLAALDEEWAEEWWDARVLCDQWEVADPEGVAARYVWDKEGNAVGDPDVHVTHIHIWERWTGLMELLLDGAIHGAIAHAEDVMPTADEVR